MAVYVTFICTIIVLGCVFKAGALVIFNSLYVFGVFNWVKIKKVQRLRKLILKKKSDKLMLDKDYMKEN